MNLLDNAIKYSGPCEPVEVGAEIVGDRLALLVRDHGVGIPTRDLERIFERFYRVDRARSRDTGGTGLGLAIVRHVAQAHGGDVTVESREGEGSLFTIHVPIANGGGPRPSAEAS
jgi:two-component system sensor histidine kinase SenX3